MKKPIQSNGLSFDRSVGIDYTKPDIDRLKSKQSNKTIHSFVLINTTQ